MGTPPKLPKRERVVIHVDFGSGPKHPAISYCAPIDVVVRFAAALRQWNDSYRIEIDTDVPANIDDLPCWQLWAYDD